MQVTKSYSFPRSDPPKNQIVPRLQEAMMLLLEVYSTIDDAFLTLLLTAVSGQLWSLLSFSVFRAFLCQLPPSSNALLFFFFLNLKHQFYLGDSKVPFFFFLRVRRKFRSLFFQVSTFLPLALDFNIKFRKKKFFFHCRDHSLFYSSTCWLFCSINALYKP